MREILFKAKRKDNGEWVEGSLIQSLYMGEIRSWISTPEDKTRLRTIATYYGDWRAIEVRTNTVCQYTGLTDKNGYKIWENDVVKGLFLHGMEVSAVVIFKDGAFGLKWNRGKVEEFSAFTSICNVSFEVIGNIFDNPELLEGGVDNE